VPANPDVIVVGGGAVGAACARELAVAGRRVLLVERGKPDGAAWRAAAGMLAPQIETEPEAPLFDLGIAGRERYVILASELLEGTGIDIGLWGSGIANVATDERTAGVLRTRVALQRQHGHLCDWLDAGEVHARWPQLGPSCGALWAPREATLDPNDLVRALLHDAQRRGATLVQDEIIAIECTNGKVSGVRGKDRYSAPDVVVAAGAWSGHLDGLPRPLSVEPVRGQMAAVPWPAGLPPAVFYHHNSYMLYRNGEAILGSTMEYVGFRPQVTEAGLASIVSKVSALHPTLASIGVQRSWAGLRPMSPDGLPIIGAEPSLPGLWYATGHGRNGILMAGITGVLVRELLDRTATREELPLMRPDRFWTW
jgi:glycine oxidase